MEITEDLILKALSEVIDPDLKQDLVSLGMVKGVNIHDNTVKLNIELTTPACPLKEVIKKDCVDAVVKNLGEGISVEVNFDAQVTTKRSSMPLLKGVKNIIAIASGKGGVGKSTIAANLSIALAKTGANVGLIDADIFGPSIPTMFHCVHMQPEIKQEDGKNYILPIEQYGVKLLSMGFLAPAEDAVVWRGPMAGTALRQFMSDVHWGDLDYLLIDLPPGTSDIHLTLVQSVSLTGAVIVTTPQKVALADAIKAIAMFKQPQINVPILGVVENMAYFMPDESVGKKYYLFGKEGGVELAKKYDIPFLGQVPIVESIRESGDVGYPAVLGGGSHAEKLKNIAYEVARQVAIANEMTLVNV